ncbi:MAG: ABC transporter permease [Desulfurococcales archaeon]|nr:ABC transporter permease [Desulfurococcales archaeon]
MAGLVTGTLVVLARDVKKWVGRRGVFIVSIITPLIWIAFFGKSMNIRGLIASSVPQNLPPSLAKQIEEFYNEALKRAFGTSDYFTFFTAGMLAVFSVFQSMFSGVSVIFDKRLGYMDRLLVTPTPRPAIFLGKVGATLFRVSILEALLLATGVALGMKLKPGLSIIDLIAAWLVVMLLALGLSSFYTTLSFYAENQEVVFAVGNLVNLPLMFTSSAIFPVSKMPHWLQLIAKVNPVTYASDLVRYHLVGYTLDSYALELGVLLAVSLALFIAGLWLSVRWMTSR